MKTAPAIALLLLVLAASVPEAARAAGSATARVVECERSLEPKERSMVAEGSMHTRSGAARLQMRFDLQVHTPDGPRFVTLKAPGFGNWHVAAPAPRRYVYSKRVENLAAPARYRMVVRFRWYDAGGRRLASARRMTSICRQPDLRPDLMPLRVDLVPGAGPSTQRYVVPVRNSGTTAAGPFAVALTVGGQALPAQTVAGLAPGARAEVVWSGPPCAPGSTIAVRADADGAIDESDEADNDLVRGCPRE